MPQPIHCSIQLQRWLTFAFVCMGMHSQTRAMDLAQVWTQARQQDSTYKATMYGIAATREVLPQAIAQLLPNLSATGASNQVDLKKTENGASTLGAKLAKVAGFALAFVARILSERAFCIFQSS